MDGSTELDQFDFGLSATFYERVLDGMTNPLVVVDREGTLAYGNHAVLQLAGWTFEEGIGRNILEFVHPDDQEWIGETFRTMVDMAEPTTMMGDLLWQAVRFRLVTRAGEVVPVEINGKVAFADPAVQGVALSIRDTRFETASQRILRGQVVGDTVESMIVTLAEALTYPPLNLSAAAYKVVARKSSSLLHATHPALADLPFTDDRIGAALPVSGPVVRIAADTVPVIGPLLAEAGFGEFLHVSSSRPEGDVSYRLVCASELPVGPTLSSTQRMEWAHELMDIVLLRDHANRLMTQAATIDPLTGLPNRRGLTEYLETLEEGTECGVLFIDLDNFKSINDRYGHKVGDHVLDLVGQRLRRNVRLHDLVSRFGGDEFTVVLAQMTSAQLDVAERIAERMLASLREPIVVDDVTIDLTASVGVSFATTPFDLTAWVANADTAMYDAKRSGGGRYVVATGGP